VESIGVIRNKILKCRKWEGLGEKIGGGHFFLLSGHLGIYPLNVAWQHPFSRLGAHKLRLATKRKTNSQTKSG
jgi:hypothetical protein